MSTDRDYLAAGLALGGLSDAELAEAHALAESDADFRSEVDSFAETMADMAAGDASQEVSAEMRETILGIPSTHDQERHTDTGPAPTSLTERREARNHGERSDHSDRSDRDDYGRADGQRERRSRGSWLPYAAAAAALIVVAGFGATVWQQHQRQEQLEQELTATQQQLAETTRLMEADDLRASTADLPDGGSVTVLSSESEQLIRFSPHDIGRPPAGKSMQMWVIGASGPDSVGLMTGDPVTIADQEFSADSVFGITVEPEGGSEQPTSDPIVAIKL